METLFTDQLMLLKKNGVYSSIVVFIIAPRGLYQLDQTS